MMTSLKFSTANYGDCLVDSSSDQAGYPQSLMLRMMQNASRNMTRGDAPRLDPQSMSATMRRDLGLSGWTSREGDA
jgi:hypothetical protein